MVTFLSIALATLLSNPFTAVNNTPITPANEEPSVAVAPLIQNAFAYPATAAEFVTLNYTLSNTDYSFVTVLDSDGKVIDTMEESNAPGKHSLIYDITLLPKGAYICQISSKNVMKTIHFTKK